MINANLGNAFRRLEDQISGEQAWAKKKEEEIAARQRLTQELFQQRRAKERQRQDEFNGFLKKQAEATRLARQQERDQEIYGTMNLMKQQGRKAYPMEAPIDLDGERMLRESLKMSLDEQLRLKQEQERARKSQDVEREKFLMTCIQQEADSAQAARLRKRLEDRQALARDWEKQKVLSKQSTKLCSKIH